VLSEFLDNQVSGNNWSSAPESMVYEDFQQVSRRVESGAQRDVLNDLERQMARFEAQHQEALSELRKQYILPTDSSVVQFLGDHRTITEMLIMASRYLKEQFGDKVVFTLRAPLDESGARTLYAVAMWPGSARDARNALQQFDDAWWIANSRQGSGNLYFTYELV
jgi:hypothetical protein